jgi:hypothetical protein
MRIDGPDHTFGCMRIDLIAVIVEARSYSSDNLGVDLRTAEPPINGLDERGSD